MYEQDPPQPTPIQAAWEMYRRLKELPENAGDNDITRILREFRALDLAGEQLPASCVLRAVMKRRTYSGLYSFLAYWHRTFVFSEADRRRYRPPEGREILSLEEIFRIAVARCWANQCWQIGLNAWAEPLLQEWVDDHQGNGWVEYHYGRGLRARGRCEEAAGFVCASVRRNPRAGWAWRNLAQLLAGEEEHECAVLRHAIALQHDPQYWGEEAERLVRLLATREAFDEAVWIIRRLCEQRVSRNWQVPGWAIAAARAQWCKGEGRLLDSSVTERAAQMVLAAVAGDMILEFVIGNHNAAKELAWARCGDLGFPLHYRRFQEARFWPVGAAGLLVIHDDRPVYAFRIDATG